jgi:nitrate/nitrite-specific signal transduction histidine kinase
MEDTSDTRHQRELLASLDTAVRRGGEICNALLTVHAEPKSGAKYCDLDGAIGELTPFLRAAAGDGLTLSLDLAAGHADIPMTSDELETILVELVTNARKHAIGGHGVVIRSRRAGERAWLLVADDGRAQIARQRPSYSGHGLLRLERIADKAGCSLRVRKLRTGGLAVALSLPVRPPMRRPVGCRTHPALKEQYHEDRQSVAA